MLPQTNDSDILYHCISVFTRLISYSEHISIVSKHFYGYFNDNVCSW